MPLKRIVESKVQKVMNGFYGFYNEFGLYVFSREPLQKTEVEATVRYMMLMQQGVTCSYSTLYLSEIHRLYCCDLINGEIESYEVSRADCRQFYRESIIG